MAPRREPAQTFGPVRRFRMARAPGGYTVWEVTMKTLLLSTSLVLLVGGAMAEDARHTDVITPDAVKWTENPAFPKGVQIATPVGDPTKAGKTVVQRIKFPPNFTWDYRRHQQCVTSGAVPSACGYAASLPLQASTRSASLIPRTAGGVHPARRNGFKPAFPRWVRDRVAHEPDFDLNSKGVVGMRVPGAKARAMGAFCSSRRGSRSDSLWGWVPRLILRIYPVPS
jgi:hypothetical protein